MNIQMLQFFFVFQVLENVSTDGIVDYIKTKNCTKIITMAGAGISTCKCIINIYKEIYCFFFLN